MSTGNSQTFQMQLHRDIEFTDQIVPMTGHAYINCKFLRCTMYFQGWPFHMEHCRIEGCVWHFDLVIFDRNQAASFSELFGNLVPPGLPTDSESPLGAPSESSSGDVNPPGGA